MKIKKKILSLALAGTMALGLMPGMTMTALAANNSTEYTLTIPATLSVANAGWNATDGITAQVKSGDTFDTGKKLTVKATSTNSWALKSGENTIGYNLATATGTYSSTATPAAWEFSATDLNADGGKTNPMGIIVEDYSTKPAGTYTDTVTFTAKVEDAICSVTIRGKGTPGGFGYIPSVTINYTQGQKWEDIIEKNDAFFSVSSSHPSMGFYVYYYDYNNGYMAPTASICVEGQSEYQGCVQKTDVIDSSKNYYLQ